MMEDRGDEDEDEEDEEGNLSEENEAMNLCCSSKDMPMSPTQQQQQQQQQQQPPLLSAKMRLKKQRLEAEAALDLTSRLSSPWSSHDSPSPTAMTTTATTTATTADGLHQLAEAAEIKQVSLTDFYLNIQIQPGVNPMKNACTPEFP